MILRLVPANLAASLGVAVLFATAIMLLYGSWGWGRFALAIVLFWVVAVTHRPLKHWAAARTGRRRRAWIVAVVAFDSLVGMTGVCLALGHFRWWLPALAAGILIGLLDFPERRALKKSEPEAG